MSYASTKRSIFSNAKDDTTKPSWVDPDDAPGLDSKWFEGAHVYQDEKLIKRGRGRPPLENPKEAVKIRYDQDVLKAFRDTGDGWQTRMNDALREFLKEHEVSELDRR